MRFNNETNTKLFAIMKPKPLQNTKNQYHKNKSKKVSFLF